MQHRFTRTLIASSILLGLAACGGGGGSGTAITPTTPVDPAPSACSTCAPGTLAGRIATGGAVVAAEIVVIDANGKSVKSVADATGAYKVDVSTLTAPFIIKVVGNVGGEAVVLHSVATAGDVGVNAVNVTPLTELVSAAVIGTAPEAHLAAGTTDLSKITPAAVDAAEKAVKSVVQPVLDAAGAGSANLRTTEFQPNRTGIDQVLDATKVVTKGAAYSITLVTGSAAVSLDPANPAGAKAIDAPSGGAKALSDLASSIGEIQTTLNEFTALFADAIPAASALQPYFAASFKHDGLVAADFVDQVLRHVDADSAGGFSHRGVRFDALRVENVIDADTIEASFRVVYRAGFRATDERMVFKRSAGKWQLAGNGLAGRVRVSLMARLKETPLTETEVKALPGVKSFVASWDGKTYYQQTINDDAGKPLDLWLCGPGQECFGTIGFAGAEWGTAERLARFKYNRYYAKQDGRVSNYIVFDVPTNRVASNVTAITVTGPGLPAGGLNLEPPVRRERPYWVFKGDEFDWNAFNADRCNQINNASNPVANCGMDWSQVAQGSDYTFTMKDAAGNVVAVQHDTLRGKPVSEADAYAKKDQLFPQYTLDEAHAFSYRNFFNDVDGPFMPGKPVTLTWTLPQQPGFRLVSVGMSILTPKLDANGNWLNAGYDEFAVGASHYNVDPKLANPLKTVFNPTHKIFPQGGWTTLTGVDAFGNVWEHELSPQNPQ
ncbi:hypothetical protein [Niveibacterium sp.]|uniref:hypothetical protein n=1 Tax=Niveibacterium sp. TaxID=2017444 RepID=UPI0035B09650